MARIIIINHGQIINNYTYYLENIKYIYEK